MTRYPRPQRWVQPRGVLEKVIQEFAPALLDDPSALSAIRHYVFAAEDSPACLRALLANLHARYGALMAPELIESFITCLQGAKKLVKHYHLKNLQQLERHMQVRKAQMAERMQHLLDSP